MTAHSGVSRLFITSPPQCGLKILLNLATVYPFKVDSLKDCCLLAETVENTKGDLSKESLPDLGQANWTQTVHRLIRFKIGNFLLCLCLFFESYMTNTTSEHCNV